MQFRFFAWYRFGSEIIVQAMEQCNSWEKPQWGTVFLGTVYLDQ